MKFKQIHAYRISPNGNVEKTLRKFMITETSVCTMTPGDADHALIELTNGVNLKVPGDFNELQSYLEDGSEGLDG